MKMPSQKKESSKSKYKKSHHKWLPKKLDWKHYFIQWIHHFQGSIKSWHGMSPKPKKSPLIFINQHGGIHACIPITDYGKFVSCFIISSLNVPSISFYFLWFLIYCHQMSWNLYWSRRVKWSEIYLLGFQRSLYVPRDLYRRWQQII